MADYKFSHAALVRRLKEKRDNETVVFPNIIDCPLYNFLPWKLPGLEHVRDKGTEQCYFVSRDKRIRKVINGGKTFWQTNGASKDVFCDKGEKLKIGRWRGLVFMFNGEKTPWIMHEYTLPRKDQNGKEIFQKWVVCRIARNGRANWRGDNEEVNHNGSIVSSNSEGSHANYNAQYINVEQLQPQQENSKSDATSVENIFNEKELDEAFEFIGNCELDWK